MQAEQDQLLSEGAHSDTLSMTSSVAGKLLQQLEHVYFVFLFKTLH